MRFVFVADYTNTGSFATAPFLDLDFMGLYFDFGGIGGFPGGEGEPTFSDKRPGDAADDENDEPETAEEGVIIFRGGLPTVQVIAAHSSPGVFALGAGPVVVIIDQSRKNPDGLLDPFVVAGRPSSPFPFTSRGEVSSRDEAPPTVTEEDGEVGPTLPISLIDSFITAIEWDLTYSTLYVAEPFQIHAISFSQSPTGAFSVNSTNLVAGSGNPPPVFGDFPASFSYISNMTIDRDGSLIVLDQCPTGSVLIRRIVPDTGAVKTIFGDVGSCIGSSPGEVGPPISPDAPLASDVSANPFFSATPASRNYDGTYTNTRSPTKIPPSPPPPPSPSPPPSPPPPVPVVIPDPIPKGCALETCVDCVVPCTIGTEGGTRTFRIEFAQSVVKIILILESGQEVVLFDATPPPPPPPPVANSTRSLPPVVSRVTTLTNTSITTTIPPGLTEGYPRMLITSVNGNVTDYTGLFYVDRAASFSCTAEGQWFSNGACLACPQGGYCPGGSRVWPYKAYWSYSEFVEPGRCSIDDACCGAMGELPDICPINVGTSGERNTQQCDTSLGYTGDFCDSCITPTFYKDNGACRVCEQGNNGEFALLIITAFVMMGLVTLGVGFLTVTHLSAGVSALLAIQQFVFVGRIASSRLSGSTGNRLSDIFRSLSFIYFDIAFLKPNCFFSPSIGYVEVFWGTLALVAIAGVAFVFGALIYALCGRNAVIPERFNVIGKCARACGAGKKKKKPTNTESTSPGQDTTSYQQLSAHEQQEEKDEDEEMGSSFTSYSYDYSLALEEEEEEEGKRDDAGDDGAAAVELGDLGDVVDAESEEEEDRDVYTYLEEDDSELAVEGEDDGPRVIASTSLFSKTETETSKKGWFVRRSKLALVMLAAAVYLQLTTRAVQGVTCQTVNGEERLKVELSTLCYEGNHRTTSIAVWAVLILYVAGFPISIFASMLYTYRKGSWRALKLGPFAFLTRGLKVHYFWFRLLTLGTNVVLAVETTVLDDSSAKIFVAGLSVLVNVLVVGLVWPFKVDGNNYLQIVIGLVSAAQLVFFLDLDDIDNTTGGSNHEALRNTLIVAILVVLLVIIMVRLYISHRSGRSCLRGCCTRDEDDIQPEEAAAVSRLMGAPPIFSSSSISSSISVSSSIQSSSSSSTSGSHSSTWDELRGIMSLTYPDSSSSLFEAAAKDVATALHADVKLGHHLVSSSKVRPSASTESTASISTASESTASESSGSVVSSVSSSSSSSSSLSSSSSSSSSSS